MLAVMGMMAGLLQSTAALAQPCTKPAETEAFYLRHLQSRLMVAALSCNQREAYNAFATYFTPQLAEGGRSLIAYFDRAGGKTALNAHITAIANAAGLDRAADPQTFCETTWDIFWKLDQMPQELLTVAMEHAIPVIGRPPSCILDEPTVAVRKAAAPMIGAAAN